MKFNCIMLVDDNPGDNFYHERVIKKSNAADAVVVKESAQEALAFLLQKKEADTLHPDLILLDINMPNMNGWEFIDAYSKLEKEVQCKIVIVMLTTSDNPDDIERARNAQVSVGYKTKPLSKRDMEELMEGYHG